MKCIWTRLGIGVIAVSAIGSLGACSTMDRLGKNDHSMYAGTRASASDANSNPIDTVFSAVGDTILLPYTGIRYLLGDHDDEPSASVSTISPAANPGASVPTNSPAANPSSTAR